MAIGTTAASPAVFTSVGAAGGSERLTIATPAFTLFQVILVYPRAGWIAIVSVFLDRTHD